MTSNYRYTYDPVANALYISVRAADAASQREFAENIILDLDSTGQVVGIEVLNPGAADLHALARDMDLDPRILNVFAKLRELIPEAQEQIILA